MRATKTLEHIAYIAACMVAFCCSYASAREKTTFYKDVQPIIYRNCTGCHRAGQSGPFPLLSYTDVEKHASMIASVVHSGYMPPWKADTTYRKFTDERVMNATEKLTIAAWIKDGMPEGDRKDATTPPFFDHHSNLGKPDLVLTVPEVFKVRGISKDTVVYFVMHYTIPSDTNVLAFEFEPGNPRAVHHSNTWVFPDTSEYDRFYERILPGITALPPIPDEELYAIPFVTYVPARITDSAPGGYPDFFPRVDPLYYDGWVPGTTARTWPEGFGFRLPAKGIIIVQVHYGPSPIALEDQSCVSIFFTDKKVKRMIESFNIGSNGGVAQPVPELVLPPGTVKSFEITADVAKDLSYLALNPHMHFLGKEMKAFAVTPANDTIPLVWIKNWDFRWQEFYKPVSLIKIPKGSKIKVYATYDNTAENPENQYTPPREIREGANSTDEMMSLIVMSVAYEPGDELILLRSDMHGIEQHKAGNAATAQN